MAWVFDARVAAEFDAIAKTQIPNYETVIDRCVDLARAVFDDKKNARIIDVGSARGRTVARLVMAGFDKTLGVDASPAMVAASAHPERIILSSHFPIAKGPFDMVLANWTLHFINEREAYVRDIYEGLCPGGLFVLSDRMAGSALSYQRYLDFKRQSGVSEAAIQEKEEALKGVLEPRPLPWYLETLERCGFEGMEVIDAAWCFNTLLCRKAGKPG